MHIIDVDINTVINNSIQIQIPASIEQFKVSYPGRQLVVMIPCDFDPVFMVIETQRDLERDHHFEASYWAMKEIN